MTKLTSFDVLIVYSQHLARSASDTPRSLAPFARGSSNESYNIVYSYFLQSCAAANLSAAFTTSADIIGPGFCKSYWTFKDNTWHKVNSPCYASLIFDKFSPTSIGIKNRRQLLFSEKTIKPFNDPQLFNMFFDKQKTFDKLADFAIPTITLDQNSQQTISASCQAMSDLMSTYSGNGDFTTDIIMKDRFGAGGRRVFKFKTGDSAKMMSVVDRNTKISYIIQPFAKFDQGYKYQDTPVSTDIRLVYLKGQIVQSYIRTAKAGDFRCNEHQGGTLTYLDISHLPTSLLQKSAKIAAFLGNTCSLFSLDFIITNSGNSYLLEGNTGPGLDWNLNLPQNEIEAKKLIRLVVNELSSRAILSYEQNHSPSRVGVKV
ncbi:MAG: hypothetical protein WAV41_00450 [Microgenomates group bacterium]